MLTSFRLSSRVRAAALVVATVAVSVAATRRDTTSAPADPAADFITGQVILVDGGRSLGGIIA